MAQGHDGEFHPETRADWRAWLTEHHTERTGVWLVTWRTATGRPAPTYDEIVEEALCFGWIDSKARRLDDERTALWCAPRKARSGWARTNKRRIERLEREGLMTPAGRGVIDAARADGSWTLLDTVEDLIVPDDLGEAFARRPGSAEKFAAFPRSVRRSILEWIVLAKRAPTRAARIEETAALAERNERANQWRPKNP